MIANRWTPNMLSDSLFAQASLAFSEDMERPISHFVGRAPVLHLLGGQVIESASWRAVVPGAPGVRETRFVNRLKVAFAQQPEGELLTHEPPAFVIYGRKLRTCAPWLSRVLRQIQSTLGDGRAERRLDDDARTEAQEAARRGGNGWLVDVRAAAPEFPNELLEDLAPGAVPMLLWSIDRIVEGEDRCCARATASPLHAPVPAHPYFRAR